MPANQTRAAYFVRYQYKAFRGVKWEIEQSGHVLMHFTEIRGNEYSRAKHGFVDKLS